MVKSGGDYDDYIEGCNVIVAGKWAMILTYSLRPNHCALQEWVGGSLWPPASCSISTRWRAVGPCACRGRTHPPVEGKHIYWGRNECFQAGWWLGIFGVVCISLSERTSFYNFKIVEPRALKQPCSWWHLLDFWSAKKTHHSYTLPKRKLHVPLLHKRGQIMKKKHTLKPLTDVFLS